MLSIPNDTLELVLTFVDQSSRLPLSWTCQQLRSMLLLEESNYSDLCAADGNLELLEWSCQIGYNCTERTLRKAAKYGHLHILQWLTSTKCSWDSKTCGIARRTGKKELFEYANKRRRLKLTKALCLSAVKDGHLNVIQYLYRNNIIDNRCFHVAAEMGHLRIVEWAVKMEYISINNLAGSFARAGDITSLQKIATLTKEDCSRSKDIETLKWFRSMNVPWDYGVCFKATWARNIPLLKYAVLNGCPVEEETFAIACECRNIELLKFLRSYGCEWSESAPCGALIGNYEDGKDRLRSDEIGINSPLEVLEWLYESGCPFDYWVYRYAIEYADLPILIWLREKNIPWDKSVCESAVEHDKFDILKHLLEGECPYGKSMIYAVAQYGRIEILEWLLRPNPLLEGKFINMIVNSENFYIKIFEYGQLELLKWLVNMRLIRDKEPLKNWKTNASNLLTKVIKNDDLEMLIWCVDNGLFTIHVEVKSSERIRWYMKHYI